MPPPRQSSARPLAPHHHNHNQRTPFSRAKTPAQPVLCIFLIPRIFNSYPPPKLALHLPPTHLPTSYVSSRAPPAACPSPPPSVSQTATSSTFSYPPPPSVPSPQTNPYSPPRTSPSAPYNFSSPCTSPSHFAKTTPRLYKYLLLHNYFIK